MKYNGSYASPMDDAALTGALRKIRHVALDMDGTLYLGSTLFDFTHRFLGRLTEMGIGYSFLTNNPTRSVDDYLAKLHKLGIDARPEQMYTSAAATIEYIRATIPSVN